MNWTPSMTVTEAPGWNKAKRNISVWVCGWVLKNGSSVQIALFRNLLQLSHRLHPFVIARTCLCAGGVVSMLAVASLASQQRGDLLTDPWDSAGRHDVVVPCSFGARTGPPQLRLNICSVLKPNEKTTNAVKQPWGLIYPEFNQPLTAVNTCTEGILRRSRMFSSVSGKRFKTMQLFSVWGLILWTQLCKFPSLDAEPKYLVAVQPIPVNDVKKHCTGTAEPLPVWVNAAVYGDRKVWLCLTCVIREGESGEAAAPGDRLGQPHHGAAVLGKLPKDPLRREHPERVSGGRVRLFSRENMTCSMHKYMKPQKSWETFDCW